MNPCINMSSHKHIILISSQPSLCSYSSIPWRVPSRETENINFVVFGLTRLGLEPNIYHIWGEHAMSLTTTSPMWLPIDRHTIACKLTWETIQHYTDKITVKEQFAYNDKISCPYTISLQVNKTTIHVQLTLVVSNSVDSNFRLSRIFIEVPNFVVYKYI
jgi:hypothetical protein